MTVDYALLVSSACIIFTSLGKLLDIMRIWDSVKIQSLNCEDLVQFFNLIMLKMFQLTAFSSKHNRPYSISMLNQVLHGQIYDTSFKIKKIIFSCATFLFFLSLIDFCIHFMERHAYLLSLV